MVALVASAPPDKHYFQLILGNKKTNNTAPFSDPLSIREQILSKYRVRIFCSNEPPLLESGNELIDDPANVFRGKGAADKKAVTADELHRSAHFVCHLIRGPDQRFMLGETVPRLDRRLTSRMNPAGNNLFRLGMN